MKVYLAYKYTNNENKEALKASLEKISSMINSWGDETFVLGRDVKKWKHIHLGTIKLIPVIFKNMKGCDIVYAYMDSGVYSKGLFFEFMVAKLQSKKSVLFKHKGVKSPLIDLLASEVVEIESVDQITKII